LEERSFEKEWFVDKKRIERHTNKVAARTLLSAEFRLEILAYLQYFVDLRSPVVTAYTVLL
jgi:hypothetical protein